MKRNNKVVKAGIGYVIANILIKGINFLTLPIFSRIMSPEQFGIYNLFISYDAILSVIIGLAMHTSLRSAKYNFDNQIDKYISSISITYIINSLILLIIVFIFKTPLSNLTGFNSLILILMIVNGFGSAIFSLYNAKLSLEYSYKKYMLLAAINSIGNILLSLILMLTVFKTNKSLGRIVGVSSIAFILAIAILINQFKKNKPKYAKKYWKFAYSYSVPIVPHGISQFILGQFDKVMIASMVGKVVTGIYSLAGNIRLIFTIITDSLSNVWLTWFYEKMNNNSKNKITDIQKCASSLSFAFLIPIIFVMFFSQEIIMIVGGKAYSEASYVVIPMLVDAFVIFLYSLIVSSEYYSKKTFYITLGTFTAAVINIITNIIFIKQYGYIAAAYTTLFSYIIYLFLHIVISKKIIKFHIIPLKYVFSYLIFLFLMGAICIIFMKNFLVRLVVSIFVVLPLLIVLLNKNRKLVLNFIERKGE